MRILANKVYNIVMRPRDRSSLLIYYLVLRAVARYATCFMREPRRDIRQNLREQLMATRALELRTSSKRKRGRETVIMIGHWLEKEKPIQLLTGYYDTRMKIYFIQKKLF